MLYCARCQILVREKCPVCSRKGRRPEESDPVLLLMTDSLYADKIEPLLEQNEIPYSRIGEPGAGLAMYASPNTEIYRFYIPFSAAEKARGLIAASFGNDSVLMEQLIPEIHG